MDFSQPLDDLSLAALKKRCRKTQERVYRDYSRAASTLGMRLSGCASQAWDALQAGFVRAFERIGQRRNRARVREWLESPYLMLPRPEPHEPRSTESSSPARPGTATGAMAGNPSTTRSEHSHAAMLDHAGPIAGRAAAAPDARA